jgi:hypothetical protein
MLCQQGDTPNSAHLCLLHLVTITQAPEDFKTTALAAGGIELNQVAKVN